MAEKVIQNEVFIRGMLVAKYAKEDKTVAVICAQNKEHSNYQYIAFHGKEKEIVDNLPIHEKVVAIASAWIYRDPETKAVHSDNLRLKGISIEKTIDFNKKVFASSAIPIYGIRILDCVRFSFSGKIISIKETQTHRLSILLSVPEKDGNGFNIVPLLYIGRGNTNDVERALEQYKVGSLVSVRGVVSQKAIEVQEGDKTMRHNKNTYIVTSFLSSVTKPDYDKMTPLEM